MRLFKNKKGIEFLPLLMVFLIPFLLYLSYVLFQDIDDNVYPVGQMSKKLFDTYDRAYKNDIFIENAAKQTISNNIFLFAKTGGNPDSECGEYMGYALITNETKNCYEDIDTKFIEKTEQDLKNKLTLIDYDITYSMIITGKNKLSIKGVSDYIYLPIYMDDTSEFTFISGEPYDVGKPADETIYGP